MYIGLCLFVCSVPNNGVGAKIYLLNVRPHNVYGERQNIADKYSNIIRIFMNQIMIGQSITIFCNGSQSRAFSHVDNVAPITARTPLAQDARQKIFNIGTDKSCTLLELARQVACTLGVKPQIEFLAAQKEVLRAFASCDRSKSILRPLPAIPLQEGIRRMVE